MNRLREKIWSSLGGAVMVVATFSACGTAPATPVDQKHDPAAALAGQVQSLQRQLRERDKRIEELESQLEALKIIDQDLQKHRSLILPPATLAPIK